MISGDARCLDRLGDDIRGKRAIVVMEGVSMYLSESELKSAIAAICSRFAEVELLMDCYSVFAAKMSKFKNPVNDVGVSSVFGFDDPFALETGGIKYVGDLEMTPKHYVDQLSGAEKFIFKRLYAGGISKKLYKLYEYRKKQSDESIPCGYLGDNIDLGLCYDMQMILGGYIKHSALPDIRIDKDRLKENCSKCKNKL